MAKIDALMKLKEASDLLYGITRDEVPFSEVMAAVMAACDFIEEATSEVEDLREMPKKYPPETDHE